MISSTCNQYSIKGIFLILLLMISTTFIQAQKADLSFSIHLKKANLKEFIFEIEKASGYSFIYGEEIILKHPITLSLRKAPLSLILQKAFAGQNISFKINKNHIILKKYALQSSKKSFTLNGYVLDLSLIHIWICILTTLFGIIRAMVNFRPVTVCHRKMVRNINAIIQQFCL